MIERVAVQYLTVTRWRNMLLKSLLSHERPVGCGRERLQIGTTGFYIIIGFKRLTFSSVSLYVHVFVRMKSRRREKSKIGKMMVTMVTGLPFLIVQLTHKLNHIIYRQREGETRENAHERKEKHPLHIQESIKISTPLRRLLSLSCTTSISSMLARSFYYFGLMI